jgi:hypothetical protein
MRPARVVLGTRIESRTARCFMSGAAKTYAVLTGDLVKSSRLTVDQSQGAMSCLRQAADAFTALYPDSAVGRPDTFRHDSWQWLLSRPELGIRAAVFLRAALRMRSDPKTKYDTRVAIGTGPVESIAKRRVSDSRGPAFTRSGKALDALKDGCLAYAPAEDPAVAGLWTARSVVPLLDCIISDWTATESRAVYGALMGWTQEQTAEQWPVSETTGRKPTRQAVRDSLCRAHWLAVEGVLKWVKAAFEQAGGLAIE